MKVKEFEIIATLNNINFYRGAVIDNGAAKQQIIFTDDENFRVPFESNLVKECNRIYRNFYE